MTHEEWEKWQKQWDEDRKHDDERVKKEKIIGIILATIFSGVALFFFYGVGWSPLKIDFFEWILWFIWTKALFIAALADG